MSENTGSGKDPELKARAIAMMIEGKSAREIARTLKVVSSSTICTWRKELEAKLNKHQQEIPNIEDRCVAFVTAALNLGVGLAQHANDPAYLAKTSADDVLKITGFVFDRAERLIRLFRDVPSSTIPELPEYIEPEIIEE